MNSTNERNLVHDEANFLGHIDIQRFCLGVLRSQDLLMPGEQSTCLESLTGRSRGEESCSLVSKESNDKNRKTCLKASAISEVRSSRTVVQKDCGPENT